MSHYAVIDLEMCRVKKSQNRGIYQYRHEVIQIGAVLMDENYEVESTFSTFVAPEYGCLDSFITELTGISPENLEGAPDFENALEAFGTWLPEDTKIVSWSMSDYYQLKKEMQFKRIENLFLEKCFEEWVDAQKMFGQLVDRERAYNLSEALNISGIMPEGNAHDGLYDAINTAELFAKMEREDEFRFCEEYASAASEETSAFGFSLGSLFAGLNVAIA